MTARLLDDAATIRDISLEALELAATYATPPEPSVYEIWYTYASNKNEDLNAYIDGIVATYEALSPSSLGDIHDKFFSTQSLRTGVSQISSDLGTTLGEVMDLMSRGSADGEAFNGSLQTLSAKLEKADQKSSVALIDKIVQLNQRHLKRCETMRSELQKAETEIATLRATLQDLRQDALIDHLTQLSNRRHFDEVIFNEIAAARRTKEPLVVAVADLDHFKSINDSYGHAAGDKVLSKFGDILKKNIKGRDTAARLGGEEFALILPNTSLQGATTLAERLRNYLASMRIVDKRSGQRLRRVTVSFGLARLQDEDDAQSLLRRADALLYEAKEGGRNMVKCEA